jgi:hypothetical protein
MKTGTYRLKYYEITSLKLVIKLILIVILKKSSKEYSCIGRKVSGRYSVRKKRLLAPPPPNVYF